MIPVDRMLVIIGRFKSWESFIVITFYHANVALNLIEDVRFYIFSYLWSENVLTSNHRCQ